MSEKPKRVRKAVLPVAGLGTRFLPATKAMPKEMLTLVDKPLIQYAVEECIASGIEHLIFVTARRKSSIEDHFDFAPELEQFLGERGKKAEQELVHGIGAGLRLSSTRQSEALGLGHAVLCAAELVGDEPFAVLLGDVVMDGAAPATRRLVEIYEATGKGAIDVEVVPRERLHFYGIIDAARHQRRALGRAAAADQRPGGKAERRQSAVELGNYRALRAAAGNLRLPRENEARRGRRNSIDRWTARPGARDRACGPTWMKARRTTRGTSLGF